MLLVFNRDTRESTIATGTRFEENQSKARGDRRAGTLYVYLYNRSAFQLVRYGGPATCALTFRFPDPSTETIKLTPSTHVLTHEKPYKTSPPVVFDICYTSHDPIYLAATLTVCSSIRAPISNRTAWTDQGYRHEPLQSTD